MSSASRSTLAPEDWDGRNESPSDAVEESAPLRSDLWEIVERLEALAHDSQQGFHSAALPLLTELGALGLEAPTSELDRLVDEVIHDGLRSPLVRGAVLLGVASPLSSESFRRVFDEWTRDRLLPRELLRAAALAASVRANRSACGAPIDLGLLQSLPTDPKVNFPSVYPVLLTGSVGRHEAQVLRETLSAFDPLLERIQRTLTMPEPGSTADEAADSILAREVVILVLGHRSTIDPDLEDYIASKTMIEGRATGAGPTLEARAAHFVIHSLADCSGRYSQLVQDAVTSSDSLVAGLSRTMQNLWVGALNLERIVRLQSMRWSADPLAQTEFMLELAAIGARLESFEEVDRSYRKDFTDFLREVVHDLSEAESARSAAMNSLRRSRDWEAAVHAAEAALQRGGPKMLKAIALGTLAAAGREDPNQRPSVLQVLGTAREHAVLPWVLSDIDSYMTEFSK